MILRFLRAVLIVSVPLCATAFSLSAQSVNCTTANGTNKSCTTSSIAVPLTINKLSQLSVNTSSPFSLASVTGSLTPADYAAGFYDVNATITVTAQANSLWGATIAASTANFASPCASKPASNFLWGKTTTNRTTPLSTTAAQLFTNNSNGATASTTQQLFFRVALSWTGDAPNTCALGLTFSITAP